MQVALHAASRTTGFFIFLSVSLPAFINVPVRWTRLLWRFWPCCFSLSCSDTKQSTPRVCYFKNLRIIRVECFLFRDQIVKWYGLVPLIFMFSQIKSHILIVIFIRLFLICGFHLAVCLVIEVDEEDQINFNWKQRVWIYQI